MASFDIPIPVLEIEEKYAKEYAIEQLPQSKYTLFDV